MTSELKTKTDKTSGRKLIYTNCTSETYLWCTYLPSDTNNFVIEISKKSKKTAEVMLNSTLQYEIRNITSAGYLMIKTCFAH